jgi:hypothetical protein
MEKTYRLNINLNDKLIDIIYPRISNDLDKKKVLTEKVISYIKEYEKMYKLKINTDPGLYNTKIDDCYSNLYTFNFYTEELSDDNKSDISDDKSDTYNFVIPYKISITYCVSDGINVKTSNGEYIVTSDVLTLDDMDRFVNNTLCTWLEKYCSVNKVLVKSTDLEKIDFENYLFKIEIYRINTKEEKTREKKEKSISKYIVVSYQYESRSQRDYTLTHTITSDMLDENFDQEKWIKSKVDIFVNKREENTKTKFGERTLVKENDNKYTYYIFDLVKEENSNDSPNEPDESFISRFNRKNSTDKLQENKNKSDEPFISWFNRKNYTDEPLENKYGYSLTLVMTRVSKNEKELKLPQPDDIIYPSEKSSWEKISCELLQQETPSISSPSELKLSGNTQDDFNINDLTVHLPSENIPNIKLDEPNSHELNDFDAFYYQNNPDIFNDGGNIHNIDEPPSYRDIYPNRYYPSHSDLRQTDIAEYYGIGNEKSLVSFDEEYNTEQDFHDISNLFNGGSPNDVEKASEA